MNIKSWMTWSTKVTTHGGQDCEQEGEEEGAEERNFDDELAQLHSQSTSHTKRTRLYTEDEDKLLCDAWIEIGQDPIRDAEQKRVRLLEEDSWLFPWE